MTEFPNRESCLNCGAEVYHRHCKTVCPQCGVISDCSDPW